MSHTFYGPWVLGQAHIVHDIHWDRYRLAVNGSTGADSTYTPGEAFSLFVDGETWSLEALYRTSTGWKQLDDIRPVTSFDRSTNLVVDLTFVGRFGRTFALTLHCVSQDPTLNPDPQGDPYDFSLPQG